MKGDVMTDDGVNYVKLKDSKLLVQYKEQAASLRELDLTTLTEEEKIAFFISILFIIMIETFF